MKRFLTTALALLWAAGLFGCGGCLTPSKPDDSPVHGDEECGYMMGQVYDLTDPTRQVIAGGDDRAFKYANTVREDFFRDRSEPTDRILLSVIGGPRTKPVREVRPKTFKKEFPTPASFKQFLIGQAPAGKGSRYDVVADAFDYIGKYHHTGKSAVLVFSSMKNDSPTPEKSRRRLVEAIRTYMHQPRTYCCFYWVTPDADDELEVVVRDAGLGMGYIVPDARRDPVRKTYD